MDIIFHKGGTYYARARACAREWAFTDVYRSMGRGALRAALYFLYLGTSASLVFVGPGRKHLRTLHGVRFRLGR